MKNKKPLSEYEKKELLKNNYIDKINGNSIRYKMIFKKKAILMSLEGYSSSEIFSLCGFNVNYLGTRPRESLKTWKKLYFKHGIEYFSEDRPINRYKGTTLSKEQQIAKLKKQLSEVKKELTFIKKLDIIEREVISPSQMKKNKFYLIRKLSKEMSVLKLCKIAGVSTSGYYNHFSVKSKNNRKIAIRKEIKDVELIRRVITSNRFKKSSRTVKTIMLRDYNTVMALHKVQRLMRENGLKCTMRKKNPYRRMNQARKESNYSRNILNRKFNTNSPRTKLLTDITYIFFNNYKSKAYLSVVKDTATKEIVSQVLSRALDVNIALETIKQLKEDKNTFLNDKVLIHSDQGVQYTTKAYRDLLKSLGVTQSMSRKANCWDNAPVESFFSIFKQETNFKYIKTLDELDSYISDYMNYYNKVRPQLSLNSKTPTEKLQELIQPS